MKIGTNLGSKLSAITVAEPAPKTGTVTMSIGGRVVASAEAKPGQTPEQVAAALLDSYSKPQPKPQPRTRRAELAPLTDAELAARYADATARKRARDEAHRTAHPVTFTIAHRR